MRTLREAGTTVLLVTHELDEAEALCDRVVAMRDGQVLDQGTPAELVARHAGEVRVTFSLPHLLPGADLTEVRQDLTGLPGVRHVSCDDRRILVRGDNEVIAHLGAWLAHRDAPVPADLRVDVPDLEAALLCLLDHPDATSTGAAS